jgi:hypothetical protein
MESGFWALGLCSLCWAAVAGSVLIALVVYAVVETRTHGNRAGP